ncbi:MAG: HalOD1 output domain-containing protein [Salinigranum sp.]
MDSRGNGEPLTYHPDTEEYTKSIRSGPVAVSVVTAIASLRGTAPTSVTPLAESVDVDAIEATYAQIRDGNLCLDGRLSFEHDGFGIAIDGEGVLHITPRRNPSP